MKLLNFDLKNKKTIKLFAYDNISNSIKKLIKELQKKNTREYDYSVLDKCETFVDLGANIGASSIYAATLYSNIKIFAFEPSKKARELLVKNIELNGLQSRITVFPFAISNKRETIMFSDTSDKNLGAKIENVENTNNEKVEAIEFNDIFELCNIKHIDFLKMDIEGAEHSLKIPFNKITYMNAEVHSQDGGRIGINAMLDLCSEFINNMPDNHLKIIFHFNFNDALSSDYGKIKSYKFYFLRWWWFFTNNYGVKYSDRKNNNLKIMKFKNYFI